MGPGPTAEMAGSFQNKMAELWEFGSLVIPRARPGSSGPCRPTNINGRTSGVWEFEATGASPAAARAAAHCTWPLALRHRMGVYGV